MDYSKIAELKGIDDELAEALEAAKEGLGAVPPADICTGKYAYQVPDGTWKVSWPGQGPTPLPHYMQVGAAHTAAWKSGIDGKDYWIADQNTGGNPGAHGYPRPDPVATDVMVFWENCFIRRSGAGYNGFEYVCNKGPVAGVQKPVMRTISDPMIPAGQRRAWAATFRCNEAPIPPTPTPGKTYCPEDLVTRREMAVFLLKTKHGSDYIPPPMTGIFVDVPIGYKQGEWIEQLYREGISAGKSPCDTATPKGEE